ncbi:MAG TPA: PepSY-associated TM helix domain-containing protein [Pseudolabrys sp.]|nr:PepSY-associated TM helix domain-containing protein [Pseudolabrys sp.]
MADTHAAQLRRLWLNVHLWIALGLCALLVPISISGGLLVWHDEIDAWINPQRYAISGSQALLPPVVYLAQAQEAVVSDPAKPRATALRYPEPGWPMRVVMRAQPSEAGARPRVLTVYLDPSTARVLDVVDFRSSFFGFLHVFHENLTIPEYSGRQIVGWAGVGMLVLSLTGLWLWWPRGGFVRGLRWRRSPLFTFNLHSLLGFWISLPLAVVSATGIYLSFPQTARQAMSSIAPMTPQGQRPGFGQIAQHTVLTADQALAAALASEPSGKPVALFLPVQQRERPLTWRTQISRAGSADVITLMTDDRTGQTSLGAAPLSGDRAAAWIRWIHEGSHSGTVWAVAVTLTGIFPTIFAVTGIIMWLRKRAGRKELGRKGAKPRLRPAE